MKFSFWRLLLFPPLTSVGYQSEVVWNPELPFTTSLLTGRTFESDQESERVQVKRKIVVTQNAVCQRAGEKGAYKCQDEKVSRDSIYWFFLLREMVYRSQRGTIYVHIYPKQELICTGSVSTLAWKTRVSEFIRILFSEKQLLPDHLTFIISPETNQHISLTGNFLECHYLHLGGNWVTGASGISRALREELIVGIN